MVFRPPPKRTELTHEDVCEVSYKLYRWRNANDAVVVKPICSLCGEKGICVKKSLFSPDDLDEIPFAGIVLKEIWGNDRKRIRALKHNHRERERLAYKRWYHEYLQSPEWAAKRALALLRDGHMCQRCPDRADCVHHLTYDRAGDEDLDDLESLCTPCHREEHKYDAIMRVMMKYSVAV